MVDESEEKRYPYKKKFQKEKRNLGDELEVRVKNGEITEDQAKEIMISCNNTEEEEDYSMEEERRIE